MVQVHENHTKPRRRCPPRREESRARARRKPGGRRFGADPASVATASHGDLAWIGVPDQWVSGGRRARRRHSDHARDGGRCLGRDLIRLLDVNVLVALAWPSHVHHRRADAWFRSIQQAGWATCPVTESGFVRISSNARALADALMPQEARILLRRVRDLPGHVFWRDDVSPAAPRESAFARVVGYRQFTDAHLLTLAMDRGGCLATFDKGVAQLMPPDASDAVDLIP